MTSIVHDRSSIVRNLISHDLISGEFLEVVAFVGRDVFQMDGDVVVPIRTGLLVYVAYRVTYFMYYGTDSKLLRKDEILRCFYILYLQFW